eukprot:gene6062-6940_t
MACVRSRHALFAIVPFPAVYEDSLNSPGMMPLTELIAFL